MNTINIEDIKEQCRQLAIKTGETNHIAVTFESKYYQHRPEEIVTFFRAYIEASGHGEECDSLERAAESALARFGKSNEAYLAKAEELESQAAFYRKLAGAQP